MTRRELFAALIAPLVAVKAIAKPLPTSGVAIAHAWKEDGHTFYSFDFKPRPSLTINRIPEFAKRVVRDMRSRQ